MSSKEDLIAALERFKKSKEKEELDRKARADEFKRLIGDKMSEIRNWIPETPGIQVEMGPMVTLGNMFQSSLKVKILESEILISPDRRDDKYSIKIEGLFNGVEHFIYDENEWISEDLFTETITKLTPELFYERLIKLIPR